MASPRRKNRKRQLALQIFGAEVVPKENRPLTRRPAIWLLFAWVVTQSVVARRHL
jgi:hypothetical protein